MKPQRIDWIDSIRGLAAFSVMICHYFHISLVALIPFMMNQPNYRTIPHQHDTLRDTLQFMAEQHLQIDSFVQIANYILGYWDLGKIGVALFFLVSGVVIPYSLFKAEAPIRNFIISRVFRLYPIYWFSLCIILILGMNKFPIDIVNVTANFTMFQKFVGIPDLNGVAWTLQIELIFYIACAMLFSTNLLKAQKPNYLVIGSLWLIAIGLAYIRMQFGIKAPVAMPLGLSLMFMGYVWRKWLLKEEEIPLTRMAILGGLFLTVLFPICFMGYGENAWTYINTYSIALVLFVLFTTAMRMRQKALLFLGKISYSVYLIHALVGLYTIPALIRLYPTLFLQNSNLIFIPMALTILCTLGLSTLTYYWIEEPGVKLGKSLARKVLPRTELKAVPAS